MKKAALATLSILASLISINMASAVSITSPGTFSYNFDTYAGTSDPTDWSIGAIKYIGQDAGTSNAGGVHALGSDEYSLGFLGNGTVTTYTATISFTNNTGASLTSLTLGFSYELWRQLTTGRNSTMEFLDVNGIGFSNFTVGGSSSASNSTASGSYVSPLGSGGFGSMVENVTFSQTLTGLNIAPGQSFGFSYTYYRGDGSGSGQSIGLDNFSLTAAAVPEPGTIALLAGAGFVFLFLIRRRKPATV